MIRTVDPRDDADMDAFQDVYAAAELAEDPDAALYSREDGVTLLLSSGTGGELCEGYGAFAGDRMVGELVITAPLHDNLQVARVCIWVDPAHQRQGIGTRLSAYADDRVRSLGRRTCHAPGPDRRRPGERQPGLRRGRRLRLANTEIERRLPLPADHGAARPAGRRGGAAPHRGLPAPHGGRPGARRPRARRTSR